MKTRGFATVLAILLAAVATGAVYLYVKGVKQENKTSGTSVEVLISKTNIAPGTAIKYEPRESAEQADQTIEVVIVALPDGTFCCTQDPPGVCVCPC